MSRGRSHAVLAHVVQYGLGARAVDDPANRKVPRAVSRQQSPFRDQPFSHTLGRTWRREEGDEHTSLGDLDGLARLHLRDVPARVLAELPDADALHPPTVAPDVLHRLAPGRHYCGSIADRTN